MGTIEWPRLTPFARAVETRAALVDAIVDSERQVAEAQARRAELVDLARQWGRVPVAAAAGSAVAWSPQVVARRELSSELAAALRIPERTAENLVAESESLMGELTATRDALAAGQISYRHAQVMMEQA